MIRNRARTGVQMNSQKGRMSGWRLTCSQTPNPFYFLRKVSAPGEFAYRLLRNNVLPNARRAIRPCRTSIAATDSLATCARRWTSL
ncbi:hypothetical protein ACLNGM_02290 [Aureimonas phyllosphaerae]|uniref:hypothetical protein n=1 Tax=Aureimonas phyllosphaerae TaxID=1166078 RepID=UPI003A5C2061